MLSLKAQMCCGTFMVIGNLSKQVEQTQTSHSSSHFWVLNVGPIDLKFCHEGDDSLISRIIIQ